MLDDLIKRGRKWGRDRLEAVYNYVDLMYPRH